MTVLITNAYLVPGAGRAPIPDIDILIEGDLIAAIGKGVGEGRRVSETIDGSDRILMPGFVNAHTHSNESFEQGFYDALPLEVWLLHKYPPFAIRPLPERVHYLRTMLLAIESLRSGVTTVQDDLINRLAEPEAFDGSASAYRDIGLRAAITTSMSDRDMLAPLPWADTMLAGSSTPSWPSSRRSPGPSTSPSSSAITPAGTMPATGASASSSVRSGRNGAPTG